MTDEPSEDTWQKIGLMCWLKGETPFLANISDSQYSYHRVRSIGIVILSQYLLARTILYCSPDIALDLSIHVSGYILHITSRILSRQPWQHTLPYKYTFFSFSISMLFFKPHSYAFRVKVDLNDFPALKLNQKIIWISIQIFFWKTLSAVSEIRLQNGLSQWVMARYARAVMTWALNDSEVKMVNWRLQLYFKHHVLAGNEWLGTLQYHMALFLHAEIEAANRCWLPTEKVTCQRIKLLIYW